MKKQAQANLNFAFYIILITIGMLGLYASAATSTGTVLSSVYTLSVASYFGGALILASVVLLPTRLFSFSRWLTPLLAGVWLVYLVIDFATFNLYRFHVNWLLVEMFFEDFRGMGVPPFLLGLAGGAVIGIGALVLYLHRLSYRTSEKYYRVFAGLLLLLIPALGANAVIHIWANYYDREEITQINPLFPLYYPVTSHRNGPRISTWLPALFPAERGEGLKMSGNKGGTVQYPLKPLVFKRTETPPSILFVLLESWQADSLKPEIMPNLCEFAATATRFDQHMAGGSTTVSGVFSLMYGLHASYHHNFRASPQSNPSTLTETLHAQGYRSRVFTESNLDRFSLRSLIFSRVKSDDYFQGDDEQAVDQYLATLKSTDTSQSPRFDFLFLTSPHSPYRYPPEFARFKPLPVVEGGYALNKMADATPYKNDYHNSLYYVDALLDKVFAELRRQGRLDNTMVVVTGDHAEEFNENGLGYWGHGSNFTRWQTQTPLIVKMPGQRKGAVETRLSLHQDVVPTVMHDVLGCESSTEQYANGNNLFSLPESRGTVFSSYFTSAYWADGVILESLTGRKYSWEDMNKKKSLGDLKVVKALMVEERRFLR
ncbi:MAG TPA: DUF3413 domain-containing protein [Planctomycetes bacterium]|nr:DUF3413 domain-containing protein [Planctomycetota bacterium]